MLYSTNLYIDLGTVNTLIYFKGKGFVVNEPSVLALKMKNEKTYGDVFALGSQAKKMLGKNPAKLAVLKPLKQGVIADFDQTVKMLHSFVQKIKKENFWFRPRMIISLPCQVTKFERQSVEEVGKELGAGSIYLLEEPVAAAIGAGYDVCARQAMMMVDIGGGTSEIAVISCGGIISSAAVRIAGDAIDQAIIDYLKITYNFLVGEQTAEKIKIAVANINLPYDPIEKIEVGGIDLIKRVPRSRIVDSNMIYPAVHLVVKEILFSIQNVLENLPPEVSADLAERGITIAGGGALIGGLKNYLQCELNLPIKIAQNPLHSVANGGMKALNDHKLFASFAA